MLFGESAGAFDTWIIGTLPQANELIHSAIMISSGLLQLQTRDSNKRATRKFLKLIGCSTGDLPCIQFAPLDVINSSYWASLGSTWPLGVVIDDEVIPEQPLSAGLKVSSIIGSNANEGTLFYIPPYAAKEPWEVSEHDYHSYVDRLFGENGRRIKDAYPLDNFANGQAPSFSALSTIVTHSMFRYPARRVLDSTVSKHVPVWTYNFNHSITCPYMYSIELKYLDHSRASHASEIPFVFGVVSSLPPFTENCTLTRSERLLGANIRDMWNHMTAHAEERSDWPTYNSREPRGMNIVDDQINIEIVDYSMCEIWDSLDVDIAQ